MYFVLLFILSSLQVKQLKLQVMDALTIKGFIYGVSITLFIIFVVWAARNLTWPSSIKEFIKVSKKERLFGCYKIRKNEYYCPYLLILPLVTYMVLSIFYPQ